MMSGCDEFNALPYPVLRVSSRGMLLFANKAGDGLLERIGCRVGDPMPPPYLAKIERALGERGTVEWEVCCNRSAYLLTLVPGRGKEHLDIFGMDISELKNREHMLRIRDQALEISQSALVVMDLDCLLCHVNSSFLYLWGFPADTDVLGRHFELFWESRQLASRVAGTVREKGYWSGELIARKSDGGTFRVQATSTLVRDEAGNPAYIVNSYIDITEQVRANDELRRSEEKYRALVEATSDWIWEVDAQGLYTYVSPKVRDILGYSPSELLGTPPFGLMPDEEAGRVADIFGRHVAERKPVHNLENVNRHKDGRLVVLETNAVPIFDQHGHYLGYRGIDRDITERKRALEALAKTRDELEVRVRERTREYREANKRLEQSEARYRAVLEDQTELICRFTPDGTLTFVNDAYCKYFGMTRDELLGRYFKPRVPEEDRKKCEFHFASLTVNNPVATLEHGVIMPDGEIRWQQWVDKAIFDEDGTLVEFQSVGRDITASVLAERTLREAQEAQENLRRTLQAVFRSMSDAIITVDKDMRLLGKNEALNGLCARARFMIEGEHLHAAFDDDSRPACVRVLREVLENKEPIRGYRAECHCGTRLGQVTQLNASPLMDSQDNFTGAVLVVRDVTRLDELEKRLDERASYRSMVGKCERMRKIYSVLEQLSDLKTTVLVIGDSGTGKELVVDALHYGSTTITGPLVKVNCAALAESLLESELFGHVRGAFTGAVQDRMGRFQAAEGGTIFLDEIGDLTPSTQLKLLRVLESKEYERVGDSTTHKADVRVVAATNRNLWDLVQEGKFRKDLYYRLKVMVIKLPPLKERTEDIPLLTDHFLAHYRGVYGKDITGVTDEVMELFVRYDWPGNVRELKHSLEHASILCSGGPITVRHLPVELQTSRLRAARKPAHGTPRDTERARVMDALEQAHWNKTRTAELLGVSRTTLYRKLEDFGIQA